MINQTKQIKTDFAIMDIIVISVFVLITVLSICQYKYGINDHVIIIPFIKNFVNSNLYPGDYIMGEKAHLLTYLWDAMGAIIKYADIRLEYLFFFSYLVAIFLFFLSIYLIAMTLFRKKEVAILSLLFLVLLPIPTLGSVPLFDAMFLTRTMAYPILLFALYFFLKERFIASALLQGIGFLIHPLSALYVIIMLFISLVFSLKTIGLKKSLLYLSVLIVTISPLLIKNLFHPISSNGLFYVDPEWLELLRLRSSRHIFPFSWGTTPFLKEGLLIIAFFLGWKYKPKEESHRIVYCSMGAILLLFICGTLFTQFLPVAIVIQFQLFRSSIFLACIAIIYFANFFFNEMQIKPNIFYKILIIIISTLLFYGKYSLIVFLFLGSLITFDNAIFKQELHKRMAFITAVIIFFSFAGIATYLTNGRSFSIFNAQDKEWIDMQKWAKSNTDATDIFIVPPTLVGFRVESERTIYGDWKDGTQMFFNPPFGHKWLNRMISLGYSRGNAPGDGFERLNEAAFVNITHEEAISSHKAFLVTFADRMPLKFPMIYSNKKFVAYEIK